MHKLTRVFLRITVAIIIVGAGTSLAQGEEVAQPELEVVAAFLNDPSLRLPKEKSWVIGPATATLPNAFGQRGAARELRSRVPEASKAVIADLVRVSATPGVFNMPRDLVSAEVSFSVADKKFSNELLDSGSQSAWPRIRVAYPTANGFLRFSRVGLDADKKQALFYVEFTCGALCGAGDIVFLRNESGHWRVIRMKQVWIS